MKHPLHITIGTWGFSATAYTDHADASVSTPRMVSCIRTEGTVPTTVLGELDDSLLTLDDVLEVVRTYLNDPTHRVHDCTCGPLAISWLVFDWHALRDDVLAPVTFHISYTYTNGDTFVAEVGAASSVDAWQAVSWTIDPTRDLASSTVRQLAAH